MLFDLNSSKQDFIYARTGCPSEQCCLTEYPGAHPDLKIHTYGTRSTGVTHEAYWQEIPGLPKNLLPHLMFLMQR